MSKVGAIHFSSMAVSLEYQSLSYNDHEISFIFMDHLGPTHMHMDDSALVSN